MGILIYVSGELETTANEKDFEKILRIKDARGDESFDGEEGIFGFQCEEIEGTDPINDYVKAPLEKLVALANEKKFDISGTIEINSDWNDYDNVTIKVTSEGLEFFNTELLNASTEDLLKELERRGNIPSKEEDVPCMVQPLKNMKKWSIFECWTSADVKYDGPRFDFKGTVIGTVEQVKEHLLSLVQEEKEDTEFETEGTTGMEDVIVTRDEGSLTELRAYVYFDDCDESRVDFIAIPASELENCPTDEARGTNKDNL